MHSEIQMLQLRRGEMQAGERRFCRQHSALHGGVPALLRGESGAHPASGLPRGPGPRRRLTAQRCRRPGWQPKAGARTRSPSRTRWTGHQSCWTRCR